MSKHIDQATDAEVNELANQAPADAQLEQTLTELAMLPPIEYDRRREEEDEPKLLESKVVEIEAHEPEAKKNGNA